MPSKPNTCVDCGKAVSKKRLRCKSCENVRRGLARTAHLPDPNPSGLCLCGCGQETPLAKQTNPAIGLVKGRHVRYLVGHHSRKSPVDYVVEDRGYPGGPCWVWQLGLSGTGYGQANVSRVKVAAHRLMYERHVGPIPDGLDLDHLCRVRACVNPAHLEPVSRAENLARGEGTGGVVARTGKCLRGHPFSGDNLYVSPSGSRHCRACRDLARKRREAAA